MQVSMMQPSFMPWLGYFELICKSDQFIFLDDFQFSVQSYHQRNRLFIDKEKSDWYSVPIMKSVSFQRPLNKTVINETSPWRTKMCRRIENNYSKAEFYGQIFPEIKKWLLTKHGSLAAQNIALIRTISSLLGFNQEFLLSSEFPSDKKRSDRVLELLEWRQATCYLCARGAFDYMLEEKIFPVEHIDIRFQDFAPKEYYQIGSPNNFIPYLSALDALMNIGIEGTAELIKHGTKKWLKWNALTEENNSKVHS